MYLQPGASQHMWDNSFHAEIKKATFKAMYGCNFTSSQIQAHEWPAQGQHVWSMNGIDHPFPFLIWVLSKNKIIIKKKDSSSDQYYIAKITSLQ